MFKFKVTKLNFSKIQGNILKAVSSASVVIVREMAEHLLVEVKKRIPNLGGWYTVYRNSLVVEMDESGKDPVAMVTVDTDTSLNTVPADETAVFFEGEDAVAFILKQYNPWPVDMLPAIYGGATATLRLVPSSLSETTKLREMRFKDMPEAKKKLSEAGFAIASDSVPTFNGRVYFDFNFMAKRLEQGLGPFPPTPHWLPAKNAIAAQADKIAGDIKAQVTEAMERHL